MVEAPPTVGGRWWEEGELDLLKVVESALGRGGADDAIPRKPRELQSGGGQRQSVQVAPPGHKVEAVGPANHIARPGRTIGGGRASRPAPFGRVDHPVAEGVRAGERRGRKAHPAARPPRDPRDIVRDDEEPVLPRNTVALKGQVVIKNVEAVVFVHPGGRPGEVDDDVTVAFGGDPLRRVGRICQVAVLQDARGGSALRHSNQHEKAAIGFDEACGERNAGDHGVAPVDEWTWRCRRHGAVDLLPVALGPPWACPRVGGRDEEDPSRGGAVRRRVRQEGDGGARNIARLRFNRPPLKLPPSRGEVWDGPRAQVDRRPGRHRHRRD
mmetsp:Transcript_10346/g.26501  ORF Transcript_10346/g.26501 Transcript_10346/m.26501 type:complete len:326 (+) Transcript_10346:826-1803(+)